MARKLQYTTLDRIIAKLYRDLGLSEISETDIVEWTGEALEAIGAITLYQETVAFVEVKNYQADLPLGLHSIIQVARNNRFTPEQEDSCITPLEAVIDCIIERDTPLENCGCNGSNPFAPIEGEGVPIDCKGMPLGGYEMAYYRPYFDLRYEYDGWMRSTTYRQKFSPIRLSNHSFFGSLVCDEDQQIYSSCSSGDEYTIKENKLMLSFKDGQVAIAYNKQVTDPETGYPMIPDEYSIITAITMYITMKYMARLWYMGREGYGDKMQKAEQDWQWYCKQAGNKQMMIHGVDEHENFRQMKTRLIPKNTSYFGFFQGGK